MDEWFRVSDDIDDPMNAAIKVMQFSYRNPSYEFQVKLSNITVRWYVAVRLRQTTQAILWEYSR